MICIGKTKCTSENGLLWRIHDQVNQIILVKLQRDRIHRKGGKSICLVQINSASIIFLVFSLSDLIQMCENYLHIFHIK